MTRTEVITMVVEIVKEYLTDIRGDTTTVVDENTALIGNDGILDSLGLIQVVVDLESRLKQRNAPVVLTSGKAMSDSGGPFKSVETIVTYIMEQMTD